MIRILAQLFPVVAAVGVSCALGQDIRFRRDAMNPSPVVARISAVGLDGVVVNDTGTAKEAVIPWDCIASVQGSFAAEAESFLAVAEKAWRARVRVERGDLAGAEPLFEELFALYRGRAGSMTQLVASGLFMCRVGRGAQTLAVEPFLAFTAACEGRTSTDIHQALRKDDAADLSDRTATDDATGLSPALPPIFVGVPAVQTQGRLGMVAFGGRAGLLGELYQAAMRTEFEDVSLNLISEPVGEDDGVRMVWEAVASRAGDAATRAQAREKLRKRIEAQSTPWVQVWCRTALGRSLLREKDDDSQMLAVAELLAVPAAFERVNPYLTGICLAESSRAMLFAGDKAAAISLRAKIMDRFPGHPVLEWDPMRHWNVNVRERSDLRPSPAASPAASDSPPAAAPGGG